MSMRLMAAKTNKAFTLVEIVVVIVVIGILAAVLIPSFTGVEDEAYSASDETMVGNLNVALNSGESLDMEFDTIWDVKSFLRNGGYVDTSLVPEIAGHCFLWDSEINRVLTVDIETEEVIYPEDYTDRTNSGNWYNLENDQQYPYPPQLAREEFASFIENDFASYVDYNVSKRGTMVTEIYCDFTANGVTYDKSSVCSAVYDLTGMYPYIGDVTACVKVECQVYLGDVQLPVEPVTPGATPAVDPEPTLIEDVETAQIVSIIDSVTVKNLIETYMQDNGLVPRGTAVYSDSTGTLGGYVQTLLDGAVLRYPKLKVYPLVTLEGNYISPALQRIDAIELQVGGS